ncbi:glycosyltransferase family 25 protein [uncultured Rothia sp.]|uniref:glycosyltransferase family 25 protein n=1 Tax=uncultured Rothia sp. TaxID=316088 RepID=UPI00260B4B09|nr:glycosyltransferase family 25 protein [uncultured Rothia sp.]
MRSWKHYVASSAKIRSACTVSGRRVQPVADSYSGAPTPAERGCILSHVKMWEDFVVSDADWALIAKDDILTSPDAEAVVDAIITKYPQVQLVNLCDAYSFKAGTMNPRLGVGK